ncbi:MAG: exopolysaccharide biosynthesis protein [Bryobacterales bacterium]|nr:exopolysaccharide biosynthesis protein [Bryobacterales bacterium]
MIDIHSHILPGIDDGALSMSETIEMIEIARATGTTALVASPHADTQYSYEPERIEELLAEARAQAGPGIALVRGCDFHLMLSNIEAALKNPSRYTIGGKCYVLMELSDMLIFPNTGAIWTELEAAGMRIILTHPERNPLLRQRLELIEEWVAQGRYMQVTAQSLLGVFGPKAYEFAVRLLDRGLVHFLASDGHNVRHRPPRLDQGFEWVARKYSPRLAQLLCVEHPRAVLAGEPLDLSEFPPTREKRGLMERILRRGQ